MADQDSAFLKFVERHDLKPGSVVAVEERDEAADSVRLRGEGDREFTIGARAASKVLVEAVQVMLLCLLLPLAAFAQSHRDAAADRAALEPTRRSRSSTTRSWWRKRSTRKPESSRTSSATPASRACGRSTFTQEWPASRRSTSSRTRCAATVGGGISDFGDMMLNYRYQATLEDPGDPRRSRRELSLIIPTGDDSFRSLGLQLNLPFSKQRGDIYFHWNAGLTWLPSAEGVIERS